MPWWEAVLDSAGLLAVLAVLSLLFLFARRRWLSRSGGTFECSVRMKPPNNANTAAMGRGWTLGLGRYSGEDLEWFRVFSFSPRPKHVFSRPLAVLEWRTPHGAEAFALYAGHVVVAVRLSQSGSAIELGMSESALTGFLAWTEAAPPGHDRLLK